MPIDASAEISVETEALILDLVEWIALAPRHYGEVMDAWRTSCPRLPVWETACDRHYVKRSQGTVQITAEGLAQLKRAGRV